MSKKLKKIGKIFEIFFPQNQFLASYMNCAKIWGPQITLEGSRDQNLRGGGTQCPPPDKVGLINYVFLHKIKFKTSVLMTQWMDFVPLRSQFVVALKTNSMV